MFSDLRYGLACALCAVVILSCTVKEDRMECPCFLTIDMGGVEAAGLMGTGLDSIAVSVRAGEGYYVRKAFHLRDNVLEYNVAVPKSRVDVLAVCGAGQFTSDSDGIHIPDGSECPVLYLGSESFVADAGEMRRSVMLYRSCCLLTVSMKTSFGARPRPYRISLEGNVSGYMMDGSPEEGSFHSFSSDSSDGLCHLRIPRQKDSSLLLEVDFLDTGEVRIFPVGEYIIESGYDWNAPHLEDIDVEMDFSRSSLTVAISKWKKTLSFEITF